MQTGLRSHSERSVSFLSPIVGIQATELLTGIGITLLGSMLPALAALWRLDDARAGRLLLAVFAGSSIGALLVRSPFQRSVAVGMALFGASLAGLALTGGRFLFVFFLLFGLGLGLAMTGNSLLTGSRYRERRASMLTLLNFSWSAGAALCPIAVHFIVRHAGASAVFWSIFAGASVSVVWALTCSGDPVSMDAEIVEAAPAAAPSSTGIVVFFSIFAMLYCGAEAALGGWVLTYVHRLGFHAAAAPPLAASCFWLSLLMGRAVAPAILLRMREERLLAVSLVCGFAAVAALLTLHSLPAVMLAAAASGLSLAPIFPICVSIFLTLARDATQARWMFAIAGVGSGVLPWVTGQIAARSGSLHTGLLAPLLALGAMLLMLRWPGGGTDLFRRMQAARELQSIRQRGPDVLSSL